MSKKTFFGFLVVGLALNFVLGVKNVLAIGQMTEPIVVKNALRGQEIKEMLKVSNSETTPVVFNLKGAGAIADWVSFYKVDDLSKKINEINVSPLYYNEIVAIFKIPSDIPNGVYEGTVDIILNPAREQSNQTATIGFSVSRDVSIAVSGKEQISVKAEIIPVSYSVDKDKSAQIRLIYENMGNVAVKPSVQLKVFDKDNKSVFNAIFPYPDGVDAVKAGERKEMPLIEWQTGGQPEGDYLSEVSIMVNNEAVQTEKITFRVTGAGIANGLAGISGVGNNNQAIVLVGVGILVLLVILAIVLILKKKKTN